MEPLGPERPIIRWAGGKRILVERLRGLLPKSYRNFYEPMLGSGALFFAVAPRRAVLADINCELINFYRLLREQPHKLHEAIHRLPTDANTYYSLRESSPQDALERAARFFYLIRLSWNGLYRVNKQGRFNVPYSGRQPRVLLSMDRALAASNALKRARLVCGDFEVTTASAMPADLVYFDPPYPRGASNGNGFSRYSEGGFTQGDQERLALHARRLADRGVLVLVTQAARKGVLRLYSGAFNLSLIRGQSLIAANSECRRDAYEAILTSYATPASKPMRS